MADSMATKRALAASMKDLMQTKSFTKISVGDICQHCSMNRKSFYYHFKDKYELVNWIFDSECIAAVKSGISQPLLGMCEYLYENRRFYTNALQVTGQNCFREYFRETLTPLLRQYLLEAFGKRVPDELAFIVGFFLDTFLMAIERWLNRPDCLSPQQFVTLLVGAVSGAAHDIVEMEGKAKPR